MNFDHTRWAKPLFFSLVLGISPGSTPVLHGKETAPPNVVLVLADDIGPGDVGFFHRQRTGKDPVIPTPHMDRIVAEGMRFTNAHSPSALCAPSRFSMLTGNYPCRNYLQFGAWTATTDTGIEPKFTTSARIAKAAGYRTAFFGKWGLGGQMYRKGSDKLYKGRELKEADVSRLARGGNYYGFDYSLELPQGIQGAPYAFYENGSWMPLGDDSKWTDLSPQQTMYATSRKHHDWGGIGDSNWDPSKAGAILADKAVDFIEYHQARHPAKPFFLYYCTQAVHIPHTPPKALDGVVIAGATPGVHGDMVRELDVQVGMLRRALDQAGLSKNTLFVLTSDNGGLEPDPGMTEAGHDSQNGLRGIKGGIYEGGHRVPFVAVWPGRIAPGSESAVPIVGHDMVATLAALGRQKLDTTKVLDSTNLLPLFLGEPDAKGPDFILHQSAYQKNFAIRQGDWKLIVRVKKQSRKQFDGVEPIALFHLSRNPAEEDSGNQLANPEFQSVRKELLARLKAARRN